MTKLTNKKKKQIDIAVFVMSPLLAMFLSLLFQTNFFISTLLFYGVPALYLTFRKPKAIKKSVVFSISVGIVLAFVIDYIAATTGTWIIPGSVFPFRILGVVSLDGLVWAFLLLYLIVMFYEHFFDKGQSDIKDTKVKYLITLVGAVLIAFGLIYLIIPKWFGIQYYYLKGGIIVVLIPIITMFLSFPKLISKFVKVGAYFFAQSMLMEITGLRLNQWAFVSTKYIGWMTFAGYRIPVEEFFFWMILCSIAMLVYYEFFLDDRK